MNVLLAPNGKPSNLTPEQYRLVRTPAFKEWFGDWEKAYITKNYEGVSKVVDADTSEPMVVYHGTNNKFNEFTYESARRSASGLEPILGFYFSVQKQTKNSSYGKYISPFFLNIKNNLWIDYTGISESLPKNKLIKLIGKRKVISDFYLKDGKEWIITQVTQQYYRNGKNKTMSSHNQLHWIWEAYYSNDKTIEEFQKEVTKILGVDGYYMETIGNENFIAFHPNQIKLADGTNTTFDSNNPDIRFAKGGKIIAYKNEKDKFNKIGVTDKYIIEAITEIGLQDTKFDKESIEKTIENEFKNLINSYQEYIISEDSNEISRQILFDKNARFLAGEEDENLKDFDNLINSKERRKEEYIEKYADTQKETINEWISYLTKSDYPVAIKFLILKSVLNFNYNYKIDDLIKRTDTTIRNFTLFDAGSLSELIASNSDYLLKDYTKIQLENAEKIIKSKEFVKTSGEGTWLKFNGGSNTTEEEISKNSIELSQLVQNTYWCTKTNSKSQLDGGDFYVYVTKNNGEIFPRIAIRMEEDLVGEVRGNKSSAQDIEEEMLPIAEEFLQKSISNDSGKKWLDSINYNKEALNFNTKLTEDGIFENSVEEFIKLKSKEKENLLDYADRNGHIVRIEDLLYTLINSPNEFYREEVVIIHLSQFDNKKTKIILGNADFRDSQITDLGQLTTIGGNADFTYSEIRDLGNLITIGGTAVFGKSEIKDLGNLTTIGGNADFYDSQVENLGNLTTIGNTAYFGGSQVTNLGNLTTIGGYADFRDSKITDLGNLTTIGGYADFRDSKITDLGNLTTINGDADFRFSEVENLGNLTTIGRNADFGNSQITDLGQLTTIGGYANFEDGKITDLGKLTTIGGRADFQDSKIKDLGNLQTIGGNADFRLSQVTDLGQLTTIGRNADFRKSKIQVLRSLTTIGRNADFRDSQVTDLGQLTTIEGNADFESSKITDFGQLTTIGGSAYFNESQIKNLGNLTTIDGDAYFIDSQVTDLGQLTTIGGDAFFKDSKIKNLGNLQTIGGDALFEDSQITDLEKEWEKIKNKTENKNKNMNIQTIENFAKGGKILGKETEQGFIHNEQQKYARIGVSDIYYIEAYITMGLQGVNFDENSLNEKLKTSLNILYSNYESYLISEDSYGIDIEFDVLINNAMVDGLPVENIEQLRNDKINPQKRQEKINEIAFNQKMTLETWIAYLKSSVYSDAFKYLLFSAILDFNYVIVKNDLVKRTKKTVLGFTSFDAGVLSILNNTPSIFLLKDYVTLLAIEGQKLVNELPSINMENGKWITFKGKGNANDEEIIKNAEKLTQLVQTSNWCTRTGALSQLRGDGSYKGGNFYVFVIEKNGEFVPKIAVRMNLNEVGEVSGRLPTQDVEIEYGYIADKFLLENINNNSGKTWLDNLAYNKKCGEIIKRLKEEGLYPEFVEQYGYILANERKFRTRYGRNGNMELAEQEFNKAYANLPNQHYQQGDFAKDYWTNIQPTTKYFIGDLNLFSDADFDFLGKELFYILGNLRIDNNATTLGNLKYISGDVTITNQGIQNFGNIESIGGQYIFEGTNLGLTTFGKLKNYGGTIDCITKFNNLLDLGDITEINGNLIIGENSALQTLGKLTKINGDLICENSKIFELPNLKEITGNANFKGSQITTLPALEKVGSDFIINSSRVKEFPNLTFIGGDAGFQNNFTSNTQNIETILGDLFLLNSRLMQFTNLKKIGKSINIKGSLIQNLGSLQYLGGNLDLAENNKLTDLGNLNYIGGYFNAKSSNLLSLNNVKQIIQFASFIDSNLEDLGALESIGGSVFFNKSNVKSIGKLNFIGGTLTFGERKDLEAEWLKRQATNQTFNDGGTITENGMYATISISLLTRLLELSNEDLKNDIQIHKVIENISNLSEKALTIDDYNSIVQNVKKFDNGGEIVVYSYYGNIPIKLENHWLDEDTDVELVPVKELIKFREFNRNSMPKYNKQDSLDTIDKLAKSFQEEGIKEPLIIEYSADDKSVLLIEGNHRLNSAEMLGIEYLPARIVLRKRPFLPTMKSRSMLVEGVTADDYGYIPSNMKPSKVGIGNTKKVFKEGGIIEGQLHSECNDETGCGRKFQVGEGGHIIEAEREEAVIVPEVFNSTENMTITGTPSEVASALNVMGGGKNFDDGATINSKKYQGTTDKIKPQAQNTDVDDIIEPSSIIVNRRSMGDSNKYEVTGTPRQIASEINSMNGNGVVIEEGGKITKLT